MEKLDVVTEDFNIKLLITERRIQERIDNISMHKKNLSEHLQSVNEGCGK